MPTPSPVSAATKASAPRLTLLVSSTVRLGRKFSASSIRMTVTTSTVIWVSARSGAEK